MARESKRNIARAHHYVPQFYLAGFTSSGSKKGTLYVHDLEQLKSWPSNPAAAGHQKDFYRLSLPGRSPDDIERMAHSGDEGVDILLEKDGKTFVVQCKAHRKAVGPSTIRELYGTFDRLRSGWRNTGVNFGLYRWRS